MNRKFLVSVSAFLSCAILWNACAKIDATEVGADLIPDVDNVHTFELILPVEIDNHLLADSTRVTAATENAIGIMEDNIFGTTEASMYMSLTPLSYGVFPFGNKNDVVLDSVVLSLSYSTVYGDSSELQTLEVYPISNDNLVNFKSDSIFKISDEIEIFSNTLVGSKSFRPYLLKDSVMYVENGKDSVYASNVLRIPLEKSWAQLFMDYDTLNEYRSDSIFKINFRGFAIKPANSSLNRKALTYWDLTNSNTKMSFYYRSTRTSGGETIIDTAVYSFTYKYSSGVSQGTQANLIKRTPGGDYLTYLNNGTTDDDLGFIQTSPGSYISVKIPGLDTFQTVNRTIHRAELIFEDIETNDKAMFPSPNILFIDAISKTGDSIFTIRRDFTPASGTYYGYDLASLEGIRRNDSYRFNLSRFLQSVVTDKLPYYTFRVYNPYATFPMYEGPTGNFATLSGFLFINDYVGAGRTVVGGGSHPTKPAKFRIIYTKL